MHTRGDGSRRAYALGMSAALALFAAPAVAGAHGFERAQSDTPVNGPLLGPAGEAVKNILGLGGFFDDLLNVLPGADTPVSGGPEKLGAFGEQFTEPEIAGTKTDAKCLSDAEGFKNCKPAAGTLNVLPDGRVMYWDALEGTENNRFSIVAEGGTTFTNDQTRVLDLAARTWQRPDPVDGGANPNGASPAQSDPLIPGLQSREKYNDGALFGSHQTYLADGRILVQGGTDYSADPGIPGTRFGVVELGGLKATRIYDPASNRYVQTADTNHGRWYPTLVPLADGRVLNVGGVRKLLKPVYLDKLQDSLRNVLQSETFDPKTERWTDNGSGRRAVAAAVSAPAPAARRQGLLQHGRAVVQPRRPGLRPAHVERARDLRPRAQALVLGARGDGRQRPDGVPRLDVLDDAHAQARFRRPL